VAQIGTIGVQQFNHQPGVLVAQVATVSSAVGIQPGDIVLAADGKQLGLPQALRL